MHIAHTEGINCIKILKGALDYDIASIPTSGIIVK